MPKRVWTVEAYFRSTLELVPEIPPVFQLAFVFLSEGAPDKSEVEATVALHTRNAELLFSELFVGEYDDIFTSGD